MHGLRSVAGGRCTRRVVVALVAILAVGFGLRALKADSPNTVDQSLDEHSYVFIAQSLSERGTYAGRNDLMLRWPPGAPLLFASAQTIDGSGVEHGAASDIPSAYWAQALVGTGTILAVFAIVALLAGALPALLAAGVLAIYPPLVLVTGDLMSEPFGAFALACAMAAVIWAMRGQGLRRYALAGFLLGVAILVRADFLFLTPLLALLLVVGRRRALGARGALVPAAVLVAAAGLTVLPWSIYVSTRVDRLTPVTTGDAPALFVGTYLPGGGSTAGMKRDLGDEARAFTASSSFKKRSNADLPAEVVLDLVAARHPELDRSAALRKEALENLRNDLGHPVQYAQMTLHKVDVMWLHPSRLGSTSKPGWITAVHLIVLALSLAGLVAGFARARSLELWVLALAPAYGAALHAVLVSQARYNLPLMPLVIAAGVAGAALAWRARGDRRASADATARPAVSGAAGDPAR
jgi:hypothetical protein